MYNYACFILSHGRANNVMTYNTLRDHGYSGKIFIIVDDTDLQIEEYKERYGDEVIIFNKAKYIRSTDCGDNFRKTSSVVFARNAAFDIAEDLGLDYFVVCDDDYNAFRFRFDDKKRYTTEYANRSLDATFIAFLKFLDTSNFDCVSFLQGGDFIGGKNNKRFAQKISSVRKVMNIFFFRTKKRLTFFSLLNDDVSTYCYNGSIGKLLLSTSQLSLEQVSTQQQSNGLTNLYLDFGTYVKSFYSVMYCPSFVKVSALHTTNSRVHHRITWNNAVPKIIPETFRKAG